MGIYNPERGEYVWFSLNAIPNYRPGETTPCRVFVTLHDIIERKQALDELRKSREKYAAIFDQSPVAIQFYDSEGRPAMANNACCEMFGVAGMRDMQGLLLFEDPNIEESIKQQVRNGETSVSKPSTTSKR